MTTAADLDVLDPLTVERLRGLQESITTEDVIAELTAIFTRDSALYLQGVRDHLAAGEREKAADGLHALKGASLSVGAQRVADRCKALEDDVRASSADAHGPALATLETEIAAAISALKTLIRPT